MTSTNETPQKKPLNEALYLLAVLARKEMFFPPRTGKLREDGIERITPYCKQLLKNHAEMRTYIASHSTDSTGHIHISDNENMADTLACAMEELLSDNNKKLILRKNNIAPIWQKIDDEISATIEYNVAQSSVFSAVMGAPEIEDITHLPPEFATYVSNVMEGYADDMSNETFMNFIQTVLLNTRNTVDGAGIDIENPSEVLIEFNTNLEQAIMELGLEDMKTQPDQKVSGQMLIDFVKSRDNAESQSII